MRATARFFSTLLPILILVGIAAAQTPHLEVVGRSYALGDAALIGGGVEDWQWSPDGSDLLYVSPSRSGTRIGLYSLKKQSGGIAVILRPTEKLESAKWLNVGHKALIVSRRGVEGRDVPTDVLSVRLLSVDNTSSAELWSSEFPTSVSAKVEFEVSPLLAHALVRLTTGNSRTFLVLTLGGTSIVPSPDLAAMAARGEELSGWSSVGTALFPAVTAQNGSQPSRRFFTGSLGTQNAVPVLSGLPVVGGSFFTRTEVGSGDPVLECVPTNGVLRPVRSPGYYQKPVESRYPLIVRVVPTEVHLGSSTQLINCLWLVGEGKAPLSVGILIAADAKSGAVSPTGRAVAFVAHGALFVEPITVD